MHYLNTKQTAGKAANRYHFVPVFLLVLLAAMFTTGAPAGELVINGDFEEPDLADKTLFSPGTRAAKGGWTTFYGPNYRPDICTSHPWEVQCNNDILIPGWTIFWTNTLVKEDPDNPGEFIPNPNPDPGRVEIQSNLLPALMFGIEPAKFGNQKAELDSHDRLDPETHLPDMCANISIAQDFQVCPKTGYQLTYWWKSRTTQSDDNDVRVVADSTRVRIHTLTDSWQKETINFVTDDSGWSNVAFVSIGTENTTGMSLDGVSIVGPNPLFEECPLPPGTCDLCERVDYGWVDPNNGEQCVPWAPLYSRGGKKLLNGCGFCDTHNRPTILTLLYDGDDDSSHAQPSDKASAIPEVVDSYPVTALIRVSNEEDGTVLWEGSVDIGEIFDVVPVKDMMIEIFDGPTLIQTIKFHAACSKPLEIYDEFGGITIWFADG